jgi:uncharacterized ferritin-like protein (DUF455 family)
MTQPNFLKSVLACFEECDPARKVERTRADAGRFFGGESPLDPRRAEPEVAGGLPAGLNVGLSLFEVGLRVQFGGQSVPQGYTDDAADGLVDAWYHRLDQPGRPARPELVAPRQLAKRTLTNAEGRAALIHAVAHIEFNAINLALDALLRYAGMPWEYYADWMRVADEEAYHFSLMRERLRELGHDYGDFPAHNGLWETARETAGDLLERMALVPRVLEARGLDVTPGMIDRLRAVGDQDTADRLVIILRDEVGHVAIGSRWFRWLCEQRGLEPRETYLRLIRERFLSRGRGRMPCPLNLRDRRRAGFDEAELEGLMALCGGSMG